jgi:hypothetical protein
MKLTGENRSTRRKTSPSTTLSTINPTWTDPGSNPGLRGGKPVANRLSHGTAIFRHVNLPFLFFLPPLSGLVLNTIQLLFSVSSFGVI